MYYLVLLKRIIILSFKKQSTYKADFFAGFLNSTLWFIMQVCYIWLLFHSNNGSTIQGFSATHFLLILFMSQIVSMFIFGIIIHPLKMIYDQINSGLLDTLLLKPCNTHFAVLIQEIGLRTSVVILFYLIPGLCLYFFFNPNPLTFFEWFALIYIVLLSIALMYSLFVASLSLNFFFPNLYASNTVLYNTSDISRYPKDIYPQSMQFLLTYILPLFLVTNPIYTLFKQDVDVFFLLQYSAIVFIFIFICWTLWSQGMKRYQSPA